MRAWTKTGPRELRPFFSAEKASKALNNAGIILRSGEPAKEEERHVIPLDEMAKINPVLVPRINYAEIQAALGAKVSNYELVATLRTHQFLRRELIGRWPLDAEPPESINISFDQILDGSRSGLFELGLVIALRKNVALEAGWPDQLGSWIAKKSFVLGIDRRQSSFRFEPLTDEILAKHSLPKGALVFALVEDLNVVVEEGQPCATVYLAKSLLDRVRSGAGNAALTSIVRSEAITAVLTAATQEIEATETVTAGSPLDGLLKRLGAEKPMPLEELKKIVNDPQQLRAWAHHDARLVDRLEKM